jgi:hypothetical protein
VEQLGHDVVERVDLPLLNLPTLLIWLVLLPLLLTLLVMLACMVRLPVLMLLSRLLLLLHVWQWRCCTKAVKGRGEQGPVAAGCVVGPPLRAHIMLGPAVVYAPRAALCA